jgi:hypothetical protein
MSNTNRALAFAKDLAEPDWSLSVPVPAKRCIAKLLAAVEAVRTFHRPIDSDHPQIIGPVCEGCSDVDDSQYTFYPCETVEAINKALEGK